MVAATPPSRHTSTIATPSAPGLGASPVDAQPVRADEVHTGNPSRGIAIAVGISVPLWAAIVAGIRAAF